MRLPLPNDSARLPYVRVRDSRSALFQTVHVGSDSQGVQKYSDGQDNCQSGSAGGRSGFGVT